MNRDIVCTRTRGSDHVVAVCFPGMDVPELWESQWTLKRDARGHCTGYMVNHLHYWIGEEQWRSWRLRRRARARTATVED